MGGVNATERYWHGCANVALAQGDPNEQSDALTIEMGAKPRLHSEFASTEMRDDSERMNSTIMGLRTAGTVFAIVCMGQLLRVLTRVDILVAGHQLPVWANALAFVITGGLSIWMWKLSTGSRA
jgi:hypothetical protein